MAFALQNARLATALAHKVLSLFSIAHRYNTNQMIFLLIRWMHVVYIIVFAFEVELQRRRHVHRDE